MSGTASGVSHRELLELIYRPDPRFETVQAEIRRWTKEALWVQAAERYKLRRGGGAWTANKPTGDPDAFSEEITKLWAVSPDRMRTEVGDFVNIRNGSTRLTRSDAQGATVHQISEGELHAEDRDMLDPAPAASLLELELQGPTEHLGRAAVLVKATARPYEYPWTMGVVPYGWGADSYDLVIDAERGIVLKTTAYLDGEPFEVREMLTLTLDEPIDDALFEIRSDDPDEPLVDSVPPPRPFLTEASEVVGFTVFVPARIDAVNIPSVTVMSGRRGEPATISLSYHLRDDSRPYGEGDILYLSEKRAVPPAEAESGDGGASDADDGDWLPVDEFLGREQGGRRRIRLERDGTAIDIESAPMLTPNRLEADPMSFAELAELAEIARALVPAPTELPPLVRRASHEHEDGGEGRGGGGDQS